MNLGTVFVSAVVGAIVSLLAVSRLTVARVRAERAEAARLAIADVVEPFLGQVRLYILELDNSLRRDGKSAHMQDAAFGAQVLAAAKFVGRVRRRLIRHRVRKLLGSEFFQLALIANAGEDAATKIASIGLARDFLAQREGKKLNRTDGLIHQALLHPGPSAEVRRLRRRLELLAAGR